jgi:hypothetical protein
MAGDKGTALSRRMFRQLAERVAEGEDPFGAGANEPYRVEILAGNSLLDPETGECIAGYASHT